MELQRVHGDVQLVRRSREASAGSAAGAARHARGRSAARRDADLRRHACAARRAHARRRSIQAPGTRHAARSTSSSSSSLPPRPSGACLSPPRVPQRSQLTWRPAPGRHRRPRDPATARARPRCRVQRGSARQRVNGVLLPLGSEMHPGLADRPPEGILDVTVHCSAAGRSALREIRTPVLANRPRPPVELASGQHFHPVEQRVGCREVAVAESHLDDSSMARTRPYVFGYAGTSGQFPSRLGPVAVTELARRDRLRDVELDADHPHLGDSATRLTPAATRRQSIGCPANARPIARAASRAQPTVGVPADGRPASRRSLRPSLHRSPGQPPGDQFQPNRPERVLPPASPRSCHRPAGEVPPSSHRSPTVAAGADDHPPHQGPCQVVVLD